MAAVDFTGQVAIVTGAGRGLGRSHAELLAARGAAVVVNDVAGAAPVAQSIAEAGGRAIASDDDISTPHGAAALVRGAVAAFGDVQVLVNNAAIGRFTTMDHATIGEYETVRRVGLDGAFYVTREVWPLMVKARYGRIVVTTSGNGLLGNPSSVTYAIAKAGVYGLMRALAIDGAELGIKVNGVAPMAYTPDVQCIRRRRGRRGSANTVSDIAGIPNRRGPGEPAVPGVRSHFRRGADASASPFRGSPLDTTTAS
jgi:NAD(P)-dependent dehydrogenase (short-subunit alcohol dehydrogenase family)